MEKLALRKVWSLTREGHAVNLAFLALHYGLPSSTLQVEVGLTMVGSLSEPFPVCCNMGIKIPPSQGILRIR